MNINSDSNQTRDIYPWQAIEFPTKWGSLKGKRLNRVNSPVQKDESNILSVKVMGIHGWLDNCNTFDKLAVYLSDYIDFIVVDLPGHGLSDHLPDGGKYDIITYIYSIKDVLSYIGWTSFIYLGHSMGALIGVLFSCVFPNMVEALISIDQIAFRGKEFDKITQLLSFQNSALGLYKLQNSSSSPPLYSKEEALTRFMDSRKFKKNTSALDRNSAEILLERSLRVINREKGLYTWTQDPKAKFRIFFELSYDFLYYAVSSLECSVLIIKASNGIYANDKENQLDEPRLINAYAMKTKYFNYITLDGSHYIHMTNPMDVSLAVNEFIEKVIDLREVKLLSRL